MASELIEKRLVEDHGAEKRPAEGRADGRAPGRDELLRVLAELAELPAPDLRPDDDLADDLGIDSLARLELVVYLERSLGRKIPDSEAVELRSVASVLAFAGAVSDEHR